MYRVAKTVEGILIQEYTNSATMYVTETFTKADKVLFANKEEDS